MTFGRKKPEQSLAEKNTQRLDRAERTAREHARRLLRLEVEVGIYKANPMREKRETVT